MWIELENGEKLSCSLLVAADGIQSQIAKQCGVETVKVRDYAQSAIIANVELSESHQNQAFEYFTPQGPFAFIAFERKYDVVGVVCERAERVNPTFRQ